MNKSLSVLLIIVISASVLYFVSSYFQINQTACTLEAKICPDGSSVGRSGPNCEFTPCPKVNKVVSPTIDSVEKMFCGGIKGVLCPTGYECIYDGKYPDAGGTCIKIVQKPTITSN